MDEIKLNLVNQLEVEWVLEVPTKAKLKIMVKKEHTKFAWVDLDDEMIEQSSPLHTYYHINGHVLPKLLLVEYKNVYIRTGTSNFSFLLVTNFFRFLGMCR